MAHEFKKSTEMLINFGVCLLFINQINKVDYKTLAIYLSNPEIFYEKFLYSVLKNKICNN